MIIPRSSGVLKTCLATKLWRPSSDGAHGAEASERVLDGRLELLVTALSLPVSSAKISREVAVLLCKLSFLPPSMGENLGRSRRRPKYHETAPAASTKQT